jgi:hypothetical protein
MARKKFNLKSGNSLKSSMFKQMGSAMKQSNTRTTNEWIMRNNPGSLTKEELRNLSNANINLDFRTKDKSDFDWNRDGKIKGDEKEAYNRHISSIKHGENVGWSKDRKELMTNWSKHGDKQGSENAILSSGQLRYNLRHPDTPKWGTVEGPDGGLFVAQLDQDPDSPTFGQPMSVHGSTHGMTHDQKQFKLNFKAGTHMVSDPRNPENQVPAWKAQALQTNIDRKETKKNEKIAHLENMMNKSGGFRNITQQQKDWYTGETGKNLYDPYSRDMPERKDLVLGDELKDRMRGMIAGGQLDDETSKYYAQMLRENKITYNVDNKNDAWTTSQTGGALGGRAPSGALDRLLMVDDKIRNERSGQGGKEHQDEVKAFTDEEVGHSEIKDEDTLNQGGLGDDGTEISFDEEETTGGDTTEEGGESFKEKFARESAAGKKEFEWNGKMYNTMRADETKEAWNQRTGGDLPDVEDQMDDPGMIDEDNDGVPDTIDNEVFTEGKDIGPIQDPGPMGDEVAGDEIAGDEGDTGGDVAQEMGPEPEPEPEVEVEPEPVADDSGSDDDDDEDEDDA